MEIELKLAVSAEDRPRLYKHPLLADLGKPALQDLNAKYFDTPDLQLKARRIGLRVRKANGNWVQTIKAGGRARAGLHERHEWEKEIHSGTPDLDLFTEVMRSHPELCRAADLESIKGALQDVFTVRVHRATWLVKHQGAEIELAIDEGNIARSDKSEPVSEVELELKSGTVEALYDLSLKLIELVPMRLQRESKAERGYAMISPVLHEASKAAAVTLSPKMNVEQGMQAIFENCLDQVAANEAGVLDGNRPEPLHQMRVGLRRFRSALKQFGAVAAFPSGLAEEMDWLNDLLGQARDWDVLSHETLAEYGRRSAGEANLSVVQERSLQLAEEKRNAVQEALQSPRYARLMLGTFGWVQGKGWRHTATEATQEVLAAPLSGHARQVMAHALAQVLKRSKSLSQADSDVLHRIRIATKRARYASEFFQALCSRKSVRRQGKLLTALQEELGAHNDTAVGGNLLKDSRDRFPHDLETVAYLRGLMSAQDGADKSRLKALRGKIKKHDLKWRRQPS
ncbi:CYTH and CHAD domain-containing protein [Noviherbaspirillum galbum]|uniref:CHAD domain-containing protein n=1 Tax=Noviherbaspirillum galbum TaxID=2709383 RepID=A0A6B3SN38_9BURK|nr:CYTH and CHAD domain-containing protein [Noviherbaspirillum galbum]NEX62234.1 CHAD domain-containing protein [Noviherbaspirillum galbum]